MSTQNSNTKTRPQIAAELGVDRKTLYNKIKKAEIQLRRDLLTPEEQKLIYALFGIKKEDPKEDEQE